MVVHGYHVVLAAYGFWLPNDPRGSWSDMVWKWELARFGRASKSLPHRSSHELSPIERQQQAAARGALKHAPVSFTGVQAQAIGAGFAKQVAKGGYTVWACAILEEHTHLVLARHRYSVEQMINLLKGAASRELVGRGLHPLSECSVDGKRPPTMWAERGWKSFLDTDEAIEGAIRYVNANPVKEGKPRQSWAFVTPFEGIDSGSWQTYH